MCRIAAASLIVIAACSGSDEVPSDGGVGMDAGTGTQDAMVDAGPLGPCVGWLLSYSTSGEFDIRNTPFGAGDSTEMVGPGRIVLLTPGDDAGPQPGPVLLIEYTLAMQFDVQMIETNINIEAVAPDECGSAEGTITSSAVVWDTAIEDYHSMGTLTCRASDIVCGVAGLPKDMAQAVDETHSQLLGNFTFTSSSGFGAFSMPYVQIPNDSPGDTFLRLNAVPLERRCVDRLPICSQ